VFPQPPETQESDKVAGQKKDDFGDPGNPLGEKINGEQVKGQDDEKKRQGSFLHPEVREPSGAQNKPQYVEIRELALIQHRQLVGHGIIQLVQIPRFPEIYGSKFPQLGIRHVALAGFAFGRVSRRARILLKLYEVQLGSIHKQPPFESQKKRKEGGPRCSRRHCDENQDSALIWNVTPVY
jgi:hypothetical protein